MGRGKSDSQNNLTSNESPTLSATSGGSLRVSAQPELASSLQLENGDVKSTISTSGGLKELNAKAHAAHSPLNVAKLMSTFGPSFLMALLTVFTASLFCAFNWGIDQRGHLYDLARMLGSKQPDTYGHFLDRYGGNLEDLAKPICLRGVIILFFCKRR